MFKELSAPLDIILGVTHKCNYSCKHCGVGNSLGSDGDLTTQELFKLIDELVEAKVFSVCIFGGEPFCRKDIFKIIDYIHSKPVSLKLNTNATLITQEIANRLADYNKLKVITVSFDGDTPEIMDGMRGKGAFVNARKGIENILATKRLKVLLSVTVTRFNFKRIREIAILGKKIGANGVRYNSVFFSGNASCNIEKIMLSPKEHREALDLVRGVYREFGDFISGSYLQEVEIIEDLNNKKSEKSDSIIVYPCGAATKKCCITADGWVTPCEVIWDVRAGNIREKRFLDIWKNSNIMKSFREPMTYSLKGHPRCVGCRYKRLCYQGHRCNPYHYTGDLSLKEVDCLLD